MRLNPFILSSVAAVTLGFLSAAAYFYQSRTKEVNDVMVFCKLQFNAWSCFDKLVSYIEGAKTSVNVCMPTIHNPAIQGRLVKLLKEKNIKVRIIIERTGYTETTAFLLKDLIDAGAEIKCRVNKPYNMQQKFCLIDNKILMTGTLNWGDDRSCDNWNYVYVTSKTQLVEPVKQEFYQMWSVEIDLQEALTLDPFELHESDDDTAEIPNETDEDTVKILSKIETQDENDFQNNTNLSIQSPLQVPLIIETKATPEVCM